MVVGSIENVFQCVVLTRQHGELLFSMICPMSAYGHFVKAGLDHFRVDNTLLIPH